MEKTTSENTKKANGVKSFIGGTILTDERVTRQIPFILFIAFLSLLLITNRYRSEKTLREIELLQDTIKDLRSEAVTNSSKLMKASRPSEVVKKIKEAGLGLEEPTRPPQKIKVNR